MLEGKDKERDINLHLGNWDWEFASEWRLASNREESVAKVLVIEHVTLDGVVQGPGAADEDPRDGFKYSGWAQSDSDPLM